MEYLVAQEERGKKVVIGPAATCVITFTPRDKTYEVYCSGEVLNIDELAGGSVTNHSNFKEAFQHADKLRKKK